MSGFTFQFSPPSEDSTPPNTSINDSQPTSSSSQTNGNPSNRNDNQRTFLPFLFGQSNPTPTTQNEQSNTSNANVNAFSSYGNVSSNLLPFGTSSPPSTTILRKQPSLRSRNIVALARNQKEYRDKAESSNNNSSKPSTNVKMVTPNSEGKLLSEDEIEKRIAASLAARRTNSTASTTSTRASSGVNNNNIINVDDTVESLISTSNARRPMTRSTSNSSSSLRNPSTVTAPKAPSVKTTSNSKTSRGNSGIVYSPPTKKSSSSDLNLLDIDEESRKEIEKIMQQNDEEYARQLQASLMEEEEAVDRRIRHAPRYHEDVAEQILSDSDSDSMDEDVQNDEEYARQLSQQFGASPLSTPAASLDVESQSEMDDATLAMLLQEEEQRRSQDIGRRRTAAQNQVEFLRNLLMSELGVDMQSYSPANSSSIRRGGRYRGREVDVDNMSYEELLALSEEIGDVKSKGATKAQIRSLPSTIYHTSDNKTGEPENCTVCIGELEEGESIRILPCLHKYHVGCIDKWLETKKTCPICNQPITQD